MKKLIIILMVGSLFAQYKYGRIEFKDGRFIEGKNLYIEENHMVINIGYNPSPTHYNKTDIVAVYRGMPSLWEIRKWSILLGSLGLSLAIASEVDNTVIAYKDALAFPIIGFAIGFIIDKIVIDDSKNITGNWIIMWKNTTP